MTGRLRSGHDPQAARRPLRRPFLVPPGPGRRAAGRAGRVDLRLGNWTTELGVTVDPVAGAWDDLGDLSLPEDVEPVLAAIRRAAADAIADGSPLLSIGGDHLVAWPIVQAMSDRYDNLTIVHFDAHDAHSVRSRVSAPPKLAK